MTAYAVPPADDPIAPAPANRIELTVDGTTIAGIDGQTIAGVLLGAGRTAWRTTSFADRPRGLFCGIGICYDCLVTVDGARDVRACQRRAADGSVVLTQHDALPASGSES